MREKTPNRRKWEATLAQGDGTRHLRELYPYHGKKKLNLLSEKECSEATWTRKIESD
jgi:hypothetical protein